MSFDFKKKSLLLFFWSAFTLSAAAQLPCLSKKPWIGYFVGMEEKGFRFGLTAKGNGVLTSKNNKDLLIDFDVVESTSSGNLIKKKLKADSLVSEQAARLNPQEPITYRGKVTGDAEFEVTVIPENKGISMTGQILNPGSLKNPLFFEINIRISLRDNEPSERILKKESIEYTSLSQDQGEIPMRENPFTHIDQELIAVEIDSEIFKSTVFRFEASKGSSIRFVDREEPAWKGLVLAWRLPTQKVSGEVPKLTILAR